MKNSTSPEGLGYVLDAESKSGETSQALDPQGLQPEFERRREAEEVIVSTRERLLAAERAAERATLALRVAQEARLKELERSYVSVVSSFFRANSTVARKLLLEGKRILIQAVDGSGASAVLESCSADDVEPVRLWSTLSRTGGQQVADVVSRRTPIFFAHYGDVVAVLRPEDAKDMEYQKLANLSTS